MLHKHHDIRQPYILNVGFVFKYTLELDARIRNYEVIARWWAIIIIIISNIQRLCA